MRLARLLPILGAIAILAGTLLSIPTRANDDNYSYARIVRLSLAEGDVQMIRPEAKAKWEPAVANMPIQQGFALGTNQGRAEIEFEHGGMMWLGDSSVAQFTELALSDGGRVTQVTLSRGTATFYTNLAAGDSFVVNASKFQVRASGTSEFRVDAFDDGGSVSELKGKVSVTGTPGTTLAAQALPKGQTFAFNAGSKDETALKPNPSADGWDRWVTTRLNAEVYGETQEAQYTNAPVSYGLSDLSMFGNWNYFPGFGYGWQPFGMGAGWAPFMDGDWMFYSGMGWTWISAEPWGWMPYHFGSWAFSPQFGWMWMPGNYGFFNPAPVQWVNAGGRIGWQPVSISRASSPMPVIVARKGLGKFGRNSIVNASKLAGGVQMLAAPPLSNGKIAASNALPGMPSRMIQSRPRRNVVAGSASFSIPTAASFRTLQTAGLRAGPPPPERTMSRPVNAMNSPRPPMMNAMPAAPRMPPPPERSFVSAPSSYARPAYSGSSGGSSSYSAPRASAPPPPSAPAPAAHAAPAVHSH